MTIFPLISAWIISIGAGVYAYTLVLRYRQEESNILFGKIITLVAVAAVYLLIGLNFFDNIFLDRALSRLCWTFVLLTEIAYQYVKLHWKIK